MITSGCIMHVGTMLTKIKDFFTLYHGVRRVCSCNVKPYNLKPYNLNLVANSKCCVFLVSVELPVTVCIGFVTSFDSIMSYCTFFSHSCIQYKDIFPLKSKKENYFFCAFTTNFCSETKILT